MITCKVLCQFNAVEVWHQHIGQQDVAIENIGRLKRYQPALHGQRLMTAVGNDHGPGVGDDALVVDDEHTHVVGGHRPVLPGCSGYIECDWPRGSGKDRSLMGALEKELLLQLSHSPTARTKIWTA